MNATQLIPVFYMDLNQEGSTSSFTFNGQVLFIDPDAKRPALSGHSTILPGWHGNSM